MPNIGFMELLVLLAFLAVLLGTVWLIARVVRRVLGEAVCRTWNAGPDGMRAERPKASAPIPNA